MCRVAGRCYERGHFGEMILLAGRSVHLHTNADVKAVQCEYKQRSVVDLLLLNTLPHVLSTPYSDPDQEHLPPITTPIQVDFTLRRACSLHILSPKIN